MNLRDVVLIVDNDLTDMELLKYMIRGIAGELKCVGHQNPEDAVDVAKILSPKFIFLDVDMPKLTGDKLLKKLRAESVFQKAIITVMSSNMTDALASTLIKDGADFAFEKAWKPDELSSDLIKVFEFAKY
jgi:CheY-like chemotaxis protein